MDVFIILKDGFTCVRGLLATVLRTYAAGFDPCDQFLSHEHQLAFCLDLYMWRQIQLWRPLKSDTSIVTNLSFGVCYIVNVHKLTKSG